MTPQPATTMRVFLIHGMGRTPLSMLWLAHRLRRAGHRPERFGYAVTFQSLERIAERFIDRVARIRAADEEAGEAADGYAVVGHSLGNLVTRLASPRLPAGFRRFVMLAPPNRPPAVARALRSNALFRFFTRDAGRKLGDADFYAELPEPAVPSLIIAGTRGPRDERLPFAGQPNDSILGVDETRLDGVPTVEVPGVHTFLMYRRDVIGEICTFLENDGLDDEPESAATMRESLA